MPILFFDAETYYCSKTKYSLKVMDNEEYVLDKRFQCHGATVAIDQERFEFLTHRELVRYFAGIDWTKTLFVAHNALFDASILVWRYGHMPKHFADTMGIANVFIRPYTGFVSLDQCARYENLPLKSGALKEANGKRTEELIATPGLWDRMVAYANQDGENCRYIFNKYYKQMLPIERQRLSWTTENYVRGRMRLDLDILEAALKEEQDERDRTAAEAGITDISMLRSVKKFAAYLESLGIEVEYKNGKNDAEIPAIAKKDPFMIDMLTHSDPFIVAIARARVIASSSQAITRANRLINMFIATKGKMLIPYNYAAAHTGRPGGTDGVNVTNFKRGSLLKKAIQAPPGKVLVDVDASQIEARICAWLAGCKPLLDAFADPARDAYCEYGTDIIYGYEIVKGVHTKERQVCKVEVLSLQYGVGAETLQKRLNAEGIVIDRGEAANHVNGYRKRLPEILGNGTEFCNLLKFAVNRDTMIEHKGFELSRRGIKFPTGHWLLYDNLCVNGNELLYYSHRYKSFNKLYAGSMNENLCQTLANIIVGRVHMQFRHDAVFMVYDSIMRLVDAERAEEAREETIAAMSRTPSWAEGLPLAAEGKIKTHL